jgi:uncharacterized protein (DUF2147 family)
MLKKFFILGFFLTLTLSSFSQKIDDVVGVWINPAATGKIKIFRTGDYFYGNLVWIDKPLDDKGNPRLDDKNPDVSKRSRKLQGLLMLTGFTFDPNSKVWENGQIYDPKSGKTYSCKMTMNSNGELDIRGFIGLSVIGRSETWKRVE